MVPSVKHVLLAEGSWDFEIKPFVRLSTQRGVCFSFCHSLACVRSLSHTHKSSKKKKIWGKGLSKYSKAELGYGRKAEVVVMVMLIE